jgi:hypothetical protein
MPRAAWQQFLQKASQVGLFRREETAKSRIFAILARKPVGRHRSGLADSKSADETLRYVRSWPDSEVCRIAAIRPELGRMRTSPRGSRSVEVLRAQRRRSIRAPPAGVTGAEASGTEGETAPDAVEVSAPVSVIADAVSWAGVDVEETNGGPRRFPWLTGCVGTKGLLSNFDGVRRVEQRAGLAAQRAYADERWDGKVKSPRRSLAEGSSKPKYTTGCESRRAGMSWRLGAKVACHPSRKRIMIPNSRRWPLPVLIRVVRCGMNQKSVRRPLELLSTAEAVVHRPLASARRFVAQ